MSFAVQAVATSGSITATDVNLKTINGVTPSVSNGTVNSGTLRVAIASDNTAFSVNSVQSGTWTVGRTWSLSSGADSVAAVQSGTWTTGRTWTTSSGTDSISAAQSGTWNVATLTTITNPVTVAQATAANLNATVVGTGTFAVQAAQAGTWNIGTLTSITNTVTVAGTVAATQSGTWVTTAGPSSSSSAAPSRVSSSAYEASHIVKASAGNLYTITGYNSNSGPQFIQVHNSTTVPADTAVPIYTFTVAGLSNFSLDFGPLGDQFSTGIVVCNSTTGPTKSIGAADCWFTVRYQ